MTRYLPRPAPLALALSLMFGGSAVWAQSPANLAPAAAPLDISIAAQPLGDALNAWARQTGTQIAVQQSLVVGKSAPAVAGKLTARQALDRLLGGSGLVAVADGNSVLIRRGPSTDASESVLPVVTVTAGAEASPGDLPRPYAGGQVARGARAGALGNLDVMDAPFNMTSYTSEFIENRQAISLIEVFAADPSVRIRGGASLDNFNIRGLYVTRFGNASFNGLYGVSSYGGIRLEGLERVEILKGPSTFVNGMSPSGAIGGTINLVPKRAGNEPLTRLTTTYTEDANFGTHLDVGRRFGPDKAIGIRANVAYSDGDGSTDGESRRLGQGTIALDYTGERLRMSFDAGKADDKKKGLGRDFGIAAGTAVPAAPSGELRYAPSWAYGLDKYDFSMVRADYDISDALNFSAAYGRSSSYSDSLGPNKTIVNSSGGVVVSSASRYVDEWDTRGAEALLRYKFSTGDVKHSLAIGATDFRAGYSGLAGSNSPVSYGFNLYSGSPADIAAPASTGAPAQIYPPSSTQLRSYVASDTLSAFGDRLLITAGVRHQSVRAGTYDKSANSPALGVVVKPASNWSIYGNYVESLQQGPTAPNTAVNRGSIFAPYVAKQYEIGSKFDTGSLITTLSVFQITQPSGITNPSTLIFSVDGEQRNRGVELQLAGEVEKGFRLLGGASYTKAVQTRTQNGTNDGRAAVGVPEWLINLGGEWDIAAVRGLSLTANAMHTGESYLNATNTQILPSWTRFDLGARYVTRWDGRAVVLRANVENATNISYWASTGNLSVGNPRTFRLSASIDF